MQPKVKLSVIRSQLQGDGEPPDNGDMEQRVAKLETLAEKTGERLAAIENRLTGIDAKMAQFATKEDIALTKAELHKAISDQTWKIIGAMISFGSLIAAAVFFIARNVK